MAVAVEAVVGSAGDVDGIDETIFAEGVGKVPKCFLVAGGDVVKPIAYAANGSAFYFAMQIETVGMVPSLTRTNCRKKLPPCS